MKSDTKKKLTKSNNRILTGSLGGVAEYFHIDAWIIRVLFIILTVVTHVIGGIVLYIVMAVVIPANPDHHSFFADFNPFETGDAQHTTRRERRELHNVEEHDTKNHN